MYHNPTQLYLSDRKAGKALQTLLSDSLQKALYPMKQGLRRSGGGGGGREQRRKQRHAFGQAVRDTEYTHHMTSQQFDFHLHTTTPREVQLLSYSL